MISAIRYNKTLRRNLRFIRHFLSAFDQTRIWFIQIFYFFSAKFCLQSAFLNKIGTQSLRIRLADKIWYSRRKKLADLGIRYPEIVNKTLRKLDEDGVAKINSVLPDKQYKIAKDIAEAVRNDKIDYSHFIKTGAEYRQVVVKEVSPELNNYLTSDFWINDCVKSYLAKKKLGFLWRIKLIRDYDDTFDQNTLFHSDTYFPTLKAFIYLDNVNKDEDVYEYLFGSHLMTEDIFALHKKHAVMFNKSPWPDDDEIEILPHKKFLKNIKTNTLVLSDTRGLHRRHPKTQRTDKWRATLFCSFRTSPYWS